MKHKLKLVIITSMLCFFGRTQETEIALKNITGKPIPFVNIYNDCGFGTITNEAGIFTINTELLNTDCQNLLISHVGFKQDLVDIKTIKPGMIIYLKENAVILDEFVGSNKAIEAYIQAILRKSQKRYASSFQKSMGYYKQITKNDNKIIELLEMITNFEFSNQGIEKWAIKNGRYATDSTGIFNFKNYSIYTREIYKTFGTSKKMASPISESLENYSFIDVEHYDNGYRKINYELQKPIRRKILPFRGSIIIDDKDSSIVKLSGSIKSAVGIKKNYFPYKIKHFHTTFEIAYLENEFHYCQINTAFDVYNFFKKKYPVNVNSLFVNLNKKEAFSNEDSFSSDSSDLILIKQSAYDPKLWKDPVIKRISEEEKAIEKFEENHAFNHQ